MDECSKSKRIWTELERSVFVGAGIDIGCGPDPVAPDCRRYYKDHGDANRITEFVDRQFDYVYSSHCLEHMHNPRDAVQQWWKLVKDGGHLFFAVPDEDLYEQGVFPSRFNSDHKATFTISKTASWCPKSVNVLDLAMSLPRGRIVSIALQDQGYDRRLLVHGDPKAIPIRPTLQSYKYILNCIPGIRRLYNPPAVIDQTMSGALAQIQCIVQKSL